MVIVNTYHFTNHICTLVCTDVNEAAFNLVSYECVNNDLGLWLHKSKPGFYALLSFPK